VSKSDILGPNANLSDIKNLVSFKREMFGDSSYSYRIKNPIIYVNITTLKYMPKYHKQCTCQLYGHYRLINKLMIILLRYDVFISVVKKLSLKSFLQFVWAGENPLKT